MRKSLNRTLLCILIVCLSFPTGVYGQDYSPDSLSVTVFSDGSTDIEYTIEPEPTLAQVNVTLFGDSYQDILVVDPDGVILDWSLINGGIQVDSLGSNSVTISYTTDTLTNKTGSQWSVSIYSSVSTVYTLPVGAVLVGLTPSPSGISIIDNHAIITMPPGSSRISYLIGTVGTQEHALVLLNIAKNDVNGALQQGIIIDEAEALLEQAITAYQGGEYIKSEQYSLQASKKAKEIEAEANEALSKINSLKSIMETRRSQIEANVLTQAQGILDTAETQYEQGDYINALDSADEAYNLVYNAPMKQGGNLLWLLGGVILIVLVGGGYWYFNKSDTVSPPQKPLTEQPKVDLNKVFSQNPHLRTDDKAILRFLEESNGAFITEIREKFDIPKSSAWRMARRLEEEGLIIVTKVGRETYLQLRGQEEGEEL